MLIGWGTGEEKWLLVKPLVVHISNLDLWPGSFQWEMGQGFPFGTIDGRESAAELCGLENF